MNSMIIFKWSMSWYRERHRSLDFEQIADLGSALRSGVRDKVYFTIATDTHLRPKQRFNCTCLPTGQEKWKEKETKRCH